MTVQESRNSELALQLKLPAIYTDPLFARAGGLMSYGPDISENFRRAATYVKKILDGEKTHDIPVEAPTKFELVVNLKTARELGLTITREFLLIADDVIE